jgi:hypothetical protein
MEIRDACRRTEEPSERIGTVASVRCELELAAKADTVWYDRFESLQRLSNALLDVTEAQSLRTICPRVPGPEPRVRARGLAGCSSA